MRAGVPSSQGNNSLVTFRKLNLELRRPLPDKPRVCEKAISNAINRPAFTPNLSRDSPKQAQNKNCRKRMLGMVHK